MIVGIIAHEMIGLLSYLHHEDSQVLLNTVFPQVFSCGPDLIALL